MSNVITFSNHAPIRIADADLIETVWSSGQDFGHHRLKRYTTKRGKAIYWISYNSGCSYGGHDPETTRTYLSSVKAIRDYFADHEQLESYHAEIEAEVDPDAIIDVDALIADK